CCGLAHNRACAPAILPGWICHCAEIQTSKARLDPLDETEIETRRSKFMTFEKLSFTWQQARDSVLHALSPAAGEGPRAGLAQDMQGAAFFKNFVCAAAVLLAVEAQINRCFPYVQVLQGNLRQPCR